MKIKRKFNLFYKYCFILLSGNYQSKLIEVVGSENLPQFLGGELVDENGSPFCEALVIRRFS